MSEKEKRPPISDPMKQIIRQRCGFGCVICGLPLYEYDHILGYAVVKRHVADEITLLCDRHHREKTNKLLPNEVVIKANENPFNFRQGVSHPYDLHYSGSECEVIMGSNSFTTRENGNGTQVVPIIIDDVPIIKFTLSEGHLLLTLNLFNKRNELLLQILDNELIYKVSNWDVEFVGRNLIVRAGKGDIFVNMTFEVPNVIFINRGHIFYNNVEIEIKHDSLVIGKRMSYVKTTASNVECGVVIGDCPSANCHHIMTSLPNMWNHKV